MKDRSRYIVSCFLESLMRLFTRQSSHHASGLPADGYASLQILSLCTSVDEDYDQ